MNNDPSNHTKEVLVDFDQEWVPQKAKILKPKVYRNSDPDGDVYCCLFGPDQEVGIYGCGDTPENAVFDWEKELQRRIDKLTEGDHTAHYAVRHLDQP